MSEPRILTETEQLARCILDDVELTEDGLKAVAARLLEAEDELWKLHTEGSLGELDARFKAEETEGWKTPANRTEREYTARQARMAIEELRHKITAHEAAIAK